MDVTQEEYEAYEAVRVSGITNMFDTRTVAALSGLERNRVMAVMKGYGEAREKWGAPDPSTDPRTEGFYGG